MVQQATVTMTGFVGAAPVNYGRPEAPACSFRMGCTRGYYDAQRVWHSSPTTWITVKAYRKLASNIVQCIHKGDPVIVAGYLNTDQWEHEGQQHSRIVLEAHSVGHDLNHGLTSLTKTQPMHITPENSNFASSQSARAMAGMNTKVVPQGVDMASAKVGSQVNSIQETREQTFVAQQSEALQACEYACEQAAYDEANGSTGEEYDQNSVQTENNMNYQGEEEGDEFNSGVI